MTGSMYFTGRHGEQLGLTLVTEAHVPKSLARSAVAAAPSEPVSRRRCRVDGDRGSAGALRRHGS